eukprot:GDKJ01032374.1.p1 GENE.GDKJ01032374.1~~GDKJ01032374.1.p1  ORF type:complete len:117 (-),score=16.81 GDKJ01032374.1:27-377(-)
MGCKSSKSADVEVVGVPSSVCLINTSNEANESEIHESMKVQKPRASPDLQKGLLSLNHKISNGAILSIHKDSDGFNSYWIHVSTEEGHYHARVWLLDNWCLTQCHHVMPDAILPQV